jgi:peptidyl-tRNA hydrolase
MDNIVQYILVNRELLTLGPGVLATQSAHAAVAGYLVAKDSEESRAWASGTFTKILLAVDDETTLRQIANDLAVSGIPHKLLEESRLQGKATAIGIAPMFKSRLSSVLGGLRLLR